MSDTQFSPFRDCILASQTGPCGRKLNKSHMRWVLKEKYEQVSREAWMSIWVQVACEVSLEGQRKKRKFLTQKSTILNSEVETWQKMNRTWYTESGPIQTEHKVHGEKWWEVKSDKIKRNRVWITVNVSFLLSYALPKVHGGMQGHKL